MTTTSGRLRLEEDTNVLIAYILVNSLVDIVDVHELGLELLAAIAEHKPQKLLINLAEVSKCSTEVINTLLIAKKRLLADGGDLRLCEMSEGLRHTYRILNLDGTVFDIYDSQQEALQAF